MMILKGRERFEIFAMYSAVSKKGPIFVTNIYFYQKR